MANLDILIKATDQASGVINTISGNVDALGRNAGNVAAKGFSGLQSAVGVGLKAAAGIGIAGLVGLGAGLRSAIMAGSDVEEMMGKFSVVFANTMDSVSGPLDEFAAAVGRNKYELRGFAANIGDTLKPLGFSEEAAAGMSVQLAKLTTDLASFNNLDEGNVAAALTSALVGNTENLRQFGVVASQEAIEARALADGLWDGVGKINAQAKAQAILALTIEGTKDAQGDALRTSGSWANQMRALKATMSETTAEIGGKLLPVLSPLLSQFGEMAKSVAPAVIAGVENIVVGFTELSGAMGDGLPFLEALRYALANAFGEDATEKINSLILGFQNFLATVQEFMAPITSFIAANVQLNDVLIALAALIGGALLASLAPLLATLGAVFALISVGVAVVALMRKAWESDFGGIQEKTAEAMGKIKAIIARVLDLIKGLWQSNGDGTTSLIQGYWAYLQDVFSFAMDTILNILDVALALLSGDWQGAWDGIVAIALGAWDLLKSAWDNILSQIWTMLTNVDWAGVGWAIVRGIGNGITAGASLIWDALMGAVSGAWQGAKDFLGIHSPSTLFADLGRQTMAGFAGGINAGAYQPAMAAQGAVANTYASTYNMTFNGGGNASDTAYAVQDAIQRTQRLRGY